MTHKHTPGSVSQMPWHDGDGYSWGGDVIVSFGCRAINLGSSGHSGEALKLAHLIAAAPELLSVAKRILECGYVSESIEEERTDHLALAAAIAKAEGR